MVSYLMVLALVLASCAPATPPEEKPAAPSEEKPAPPSEEKPAPPKEEKPAPAPGEPKYGGVFIEAVAAEPLYFDESFSLAHNARSLEITNEELMIGDWAKGPAGTGETFWVINMMESQDVMAGCLAESWELVDDTTIVFHIRQGVHFHNKPPTNGREMTSDDVVFSFRRQLTTQTAYHRSAYAWETHLAGHPDESITAPDKWTVVVKTAPGKTGRIWEILCEFLKIVPRDAVEYYGNLGDWKNCIGTGPFVITDYVPGSSLSFERHPNYWMKDPIHPENQLPYLDGVKWLFIKDPSTSMAALRTGKIDRLGVSWEDAQTIRKTNPELQYLRYNPGYAMAIYLRCDRTDLPTYNVKVRQALSMAVDNKAIADSYYGGNAEILTYPIANIPEWKGIYRSPEEYGGIIQEMFEYHPDKAKQLLAEAGYPNGFKLAVITESGYVDLLSIVKANWADVGVDLDIQVRELGVYTAMGLKKTYDAYMKITDGNLIFKAIYTDPDNSWNFSQINDPKINAHFKEVSAAYFDMAKAKQMERDITPHKLEQAIMVQMPGWYAYTFWQPRVKNYHGEEVVGYQNVFQQVRWVWIDQTVK